MKDLSLFPAQCCFETSWLIFLSLLDRKLGDIEVLTDLMIENYNWVRNQRDSFDKKWRLPGDKNTSLSLVRMRLSTGY